ncbi:MAG: Rieske 2Fe-2S domain-containing protein [Acidobacteria bacterium]|nr:Rieske 2Fe-2S domain-containing protein [Acidobacteriota bacterium]
MPERVKVAVRSEVPSGAGKVVIALGRVLALFNVDGDFFAVDNSCPHRGGPLGEGYLQGRVVTCPWHGWQFDVTTGESPLNPRHHVRCVRLERDGEDLFVILD